MGLLYSYSQPHSVPLVLSWLRVQCEVPVENPYPGTDHDERDLVLPATSKIGVRYDKEGEVRHNAESGHMKDRRAKTRNRKIHPHGCIFSVSASLLLACPAVK